MLLPLLEFTLQVDPCVGYLRGVISVSKGRMLKNFCSILRDFCV